MNEFSEHRSISVHSTCTVHTVRTFGIGVVPLEHTDGGVCDLQCAAYRVFVRRTACVRHLHGAIHFDTEPDVVVLRREPVILCAELVHFNIIVTICVQL